MGILSSCDFIKRQFGTNYIVNAVQEDATLNEILVGFVQRWHEEHSTATDDEATCSSRIRNAPFPETVDDGINVSSPPYDFNHSTNERTFLGEPSQPVVVDIINNIDDLGLTLKAISALIKLLGDEDPIVAGDAANIIHSLSKRETVSAALANSPYLINAVILLMKSSDVPETTKYTVATLYNLSRQPYGLMKLLASNEIPALIPLLDSPINSVVFYAIAILHNLLIMHHPNDAKESIRRANGVPCMSTLLKTKNQPKFLAIVVDCLYNLALNNQETKTIILQHGVPIELVRIMKTFEDEQLLLTTARLLYTLSICPQNKNAIVVAGGLQALLSRLKHESQCLVRTFLLAARNLSDGGLKEENVEPLLHGLLQLTGSADRVVLSCCVCILSNITCDNMHNKAIICRAGGVAILMRILEPPMSEVEIVEAALCTLRHLTISHPDVDMALNEVRLYRNGLHLIAQYVRIQPHVPLMCVKTAMGLIRNLCLNAFNLPSFYEFDVVHNVCNHLIASYRLVQQAQHTNTPSPMVDGVMCEEMIENSVNALQQLAKDDKNRAYMRKAQIIAILAQLLYFEKNDNIPRVAAGALSELVVDPEGARMIEQQGGAVAQLTELLHSPDKGVATYSARNRPEENYQKHLEEESAALPLDD